MSVFDFDHRPVYLCLTLIMDQYVFDSQLGLGFRHVPESLLFEYMFSFL